MVENKCSGDGGDMEVEELVAGPWRGTFFGCGRAALTYDVLWIIKLHM